MMHSKRRDSSHWISRGCDQIVDMEWHCNLCNNMTITVGLRTCGGSDDDANIYGRTVTVRESIDGVMYRLCGVYGSSLLKRNVDVIMGHCGAQTSIDLVEHMNRLKKRG
eukprot:113783_1